MVPCESRFHYCLLSLKKRLIIYGEIEDGGSSSYEGNGMLSSVYITIAQTIV